MSHEPSFDYYAELEVGRSASAQDVTSSYRRLALIHHPDRNPDCQGEATARFQRLQLAYETLSDAAKRAHYDNPQQAPLSPFYDFDDEAEPWDEDSDEDDDEYFDFFPGFQDHGGFSSHGFRGSHAGRSHRRASYGTKAFEEMEAELEAEMERMRQEFEQQQRQEAERSQRKAQREAELNAEALKETTGKKRRRGEEEQKQQQRWKGLNAITRDERLAACLHSDFCQKVQQQKKFKCSACSAKRGMIAFECPYCSSFLCQLCVTKFSNWRDRLNKPSGPKSAQGTHDHDEDVNPSLDSNAATDTEATFAKPSSPRRKTSSKTENVSSQKTADSGDDTVNDTANSGKDGKAKAKSNEPATDATSPSKHQTSGCTAKATPGATRGFIRNTKPGRGASLALLREAMEQFGAVTSLKITNKRAGNAHVEFSDHVGLCQAMAASPVAVTNNATVDVVELQECGRCGKCGHVAEQCRNAPQ